MLRVIMIVTGILIMIASLIPLLSLADVTISGFNIGEKFQESKLPDSPTVYFLIIFILSLIAVIYAIKSRKVVY